MSHSETLTTDEDRTGRWSLTMAWWALFSAMFWLYIAVASAGAVGVENTLIGMTLSVATYGVINAVLSRYANRTGMTVEVLSRSLFGTLGSALATLIFAATAIYYAVFEGSIIAHALNEYFGGEIKVWYFVVVLYALPLVAGGVQNWLDRLNGALLPFYIVGLLAAVAVTARDQGMPSAWPAGLQGPLPGWATSYLIFMGVWVMMMYTFDFARMGRREDSRFHSQVTFGWVFYLATFGFNGLIGIYLVTAWGTSSTEVGVVEAMIQSLGFGGVLVIIVSQTRINTANYYLASSNLEAFAAHTLGLRLPRFAWVLVAGALAYLFMLTDVLSYLLTALAWQGVFVTAWVAIALVHIYRMRNHDAIPESRSDRLPFVAGGALSWILASVIGIYLVEQPPSPLLGQLAPAITVAIAVVTYALVCLVAPPVLVEPDKLDATTAA